MEGNVVVSDMPARTLHDGYREVIESILTEYTKIPYAYGDMPRPCLIANGTVTSW